MQSDVVGSYDRATQTIARRLPATAFAAPLGNGKQQKGFGC
jgi:hypothetical protein